MSSGSTRIAITTSTNCSGVTSFTTISRTVGNWQQSRDWTRTCTTWHYQEWTYTRSTLGATTCLTSAKWICFKMISIAQLFLVALRSMQSTLKSNVVTLSKRLRLKTSLSWTTNGWLRTRSNWKEATLESSLKTGLSKKLIQSCSETPFSSPEIYSCKTRAVRETNSSSKITTSLNLSLTSVYLTWWWGIQSLTSPSTWTQPKEPQTELTQLMPPSSSNVMKIKAKTTSSPATPSKQPKPNQSDSDTCLQMYCVSRAGRYQMFTSCIKLTRCTKNWSASILSMAQSMALTISGSASPLSRLAESESSASEVCENSSMVKPRSKCVQK